MRVHHRRQVVEPAGRCVLRGPDHVHPEHVALARFGSQALDLLFALDIGAFGELEQVGFEARVLLVELVDGSFEGAARVLPDAPGDVSRRPFGVGRLERARI